MSSTIWDFISHEAKDLINNLLQVDPMKKLSPYQALKHPWICKIHPLGDSYSIFNPKAFSTKNYYTHQNQQKVFNFETEEINNLNNFHNKNSILKQY